MIVFIYLLETKINRKKLADLPIPRVYNRREEVFCTKKGYFDIMTIYIYIT